MDLLVHLREECVRPPVLGGAILERFVECLCLGESVDLAVSIVVVLVEVALVLHRGQVTNRLLQNELATQTFFLNEESETQKCGINWDLILSCRSLFCVILENPVSVFVIGSLLDHSKLKLRKSLTFHEKLAG